MPIKEEVAVWFKAGYHIWKKEKPDWYDEEYSHRVALYLMPPSSLLDKLRKNSTNSLNLRKNSTNSVKKQTSFSNATNSLRNKIKKQKSFSNTTKVGGLLIDPPPLTDKRGSRVGVDGVEAV